MKIKLLMLHLMNPLGSMVGGVETYLKNFIKYAPDDFEIYFVGLAMDKKLIGAWQEIEMQGKKINFFPSLYVKDENKRTKIPLSLRFTASLLRHRKQIMAEDKILICHRVEPSLPFRNVRGKKVLFAHSDMKALHNRHAESRWRKFPWLYFQMEKRLIGAMDRVFVVSEDGVDFYGKTYPFMQKRISFLPMWFDEKMFFPYSNEDKKRRKGIFLAEKGFSSNSRLILFAGRLTEPKDPLLLIESFRYVNERIPETRLLIAGDGALKGRMMDMVVKYGLQEKACFMGMLSQDKVSEIMRISDVFCLTSAFEMGPRIVWEALACGLPVVSTDVGGVKMVIKNGISGSICKERNPSIIGEAVLKLLKQSPSVRNCISSVQDYTARRVLNGVYEFYKDL